MPNTFVDYLPPPPPTYKFHPEDPLEVDDVPLRILMAEFPRMIFALIRNMKSKFMVGLLFSMFVTNTILYNGGS